MIRVHQVLCPLEHKGNCELLKSICAKKLNIKSSEIHTLQIYRESLDARKKPFHFSYTLDLTLANEAKCLRHKDVKKIINEAYQTPHKGTLHQTGRIVVAGFGPAGMFAALLLAQQGYRPLVLERGAEMEERMAQVMHFWQTGILNPDANVQFGEGGAGTFSDGKLTSRSKDLRSHKVLEELVHFGAPKAILYEARPHIGTDRLRDIVVAIRKEIIRLGGEVRFLSPLSDLEVENGRIHAVISNQTRIPCAALLLAIGHSARDTFALCAKKGIVLEPKAFAIGVRVEHPQQLINQAQYKEYVNHPNLRAAEYQLTYTTSKHRGVYSFCMCPGGYVVNAASECGGIVVNGMSEHARDGANANSAILVQVRPEDVGSAQLDGIHFQQQLEQKAFQMGDQPYYAPIQRMKDFMNQTKTVQLGSVTPTIRPGYTFANLHELLPDFVSEALLEAFPVFEQKMQGFLDGDALLSGIETRSSSPLRMPRDAKSLCSFGVDNLYPGGEGAGYAGGIVSAAIDGLRCAEQIIARFAPPTQ